MNDDARTDGGTASATDSGASAGPLAEVDGYRVLLYLGLLGILAFFMMIDDVITSHSLGPHWAWYAIPLAVFFNILSVVLPVNPISDMLDQRYESEDKKLAVYMLLSAILGVIWIII